MTISYPHPPPTSGLVNKYKYNQSVVSVAATDVNIVKAGLLIGRGHSLFIVLSLATGLPLVVAHCGDCTIQLARCTTTGSGQGGKQTLLQCLPITI